MTDIDFRRFASLLITLKLLETSQEPAKEAAEIANKLLDELQRFET